MLSTRFVPGAPNWLDLRTPGIAAAADFYGGLFGWKFQSAGPEAGGYGLFRHGGKTVAAVGPLTEEGTRSAWTLYFRTNDADATAEAVRRAGGTVRVEPQDVFTDGRMAGFTDPGGAQFAVWQPGGTQGLEAVNDTGCLCWAELYTPQPAGVRAFYRSVFGWETEDMPFAGLTYTVLSTAGGGQEASFGGVMPLTEAQIASGATPRWLPYFEVEECDTVVTRAKQLGGQIIMPAMDAEGVGRFTQFDDPFGAPLAVITSSSPAA